MQVPPPTSTSKIPLRKREPDNSIRPRRNSTGTKSILDRVIVESDSLLAVEIINEGCNSNHSSFPIAMNVIELLKEGSVVTCSHIFREVNNVSNSLAS